jgi:hypothetical protein
VYFDQLDGFDVVLTLAKSVITIIALGKSVIQQASCLERSDMPVILVLLELLDIDFHATVFM